MRDLLFRGRAYGHKIPGAGGTQEVLRLHPDTVTVERDPRTLALRYLVQRSDGRRVVLPREEVLHVWRDSDDGIDGISPIAAHRETIGDGIAIRQHGSKFFANAARISGVLEAPEGSKLGAASVKALIDDFEQLYRGNENAHKTAVLPGGIKFKETTINMEDAQWIEAKKATAREICGILGVPPHKIGDLADATFSNVESENVSYVVNSLTPWLVCLEQVINRDLLGNDPELYVKFTVDGLLRGDSKSRAEALQIQRRSGVINANEWRALEEMNPRSDLGGEEYIVEQNMRIQDGTPPAPPATPPIRQSTPPATRNGHLQTDLDVGVN
jgi:HK97 family phage portal protein